jgi:hypothetical protein
LLVVLGEQEEVRVEIPNPNREFPPISAVWPTQAPEPKHSGLGILAFILSVITGVLMFTTFVCAGVMEMSTPGGLDESSTMAIVVGLSIFLLIGIDLLACGLAIGGLCQANRRKVFAVLAICCSLGGVATTAGFLCLGLMMQD